MSSETNSNEIPVNIISENQIDTDSSIEESPSSEIDVEKMSKLLDLENNAKEDVLACTEYKNILINMLWGTKECEF